jgi:serine/threonine-protein kinase
MTAVRFDADARRVVGSAIQISDPVAISALGVANLALSTNGTMVYVPRGGASTPSRQLLIVDRDGHESPINAPLRNYMGVRFSPDGTRLVVNTYDEDNDNLWVWDTVRQLFSRLTFDRALDYAPVWTPDGQHVIFTSTRTGSGNLYIHAADGSGADARLTSNPNTQVPSSVTRDGRTILAYENRTTSAYDLIAVPFDPGAAEPVEQARTLTALAGRQQNPIVSPDGRFLAYESDESGRFEVYVQPYPSLAGGRWQVSTAGGTQPAWSRAGRELLFLDGDHHLTSVSTDTTGTTLRYGGPVRLLQTAYITPEIFRSYDVSPDGQRFVFLKEAATPSHAGVVVVQHWQDELAHAPSLVR